MTKTRDLADLGGGFIQAGTGAQQRTVESKLQDVVSVKDFGVIGNGVFDDSTNIQTAINTLSAGGTLVFPPGNYFCNTGLTVSSNNVNLVFEGNAKLSYTTATQTLLTVSGDNCKLVNAVIDAPAVFDGTNTTITYSVVKITGDFFSAEHCTLNNVPRCGFFFNDSNNGAIRHCIINGGTTEGFFTGLNTVHFGIYIDPSPLSSQGNFIISDNFINRCVQGGGTGNFGPASFEQSITVSGNVFELCWNHGWYTAGFANGVTITANAFNSCQLPIAATGRNHTIVGNAMTVNTTGSGLVTDNEVTGISLRDPVNCIVSNNSIKGENVNGGTVISLDDIASLPGNNRVEGNIVSNNTIEITNNTVAGVVAIRLLAQTTTPAINNIVSGNVIKAPIRLNNGLISISGSSSAYSGGNSICDNVVIANGLQGTLGYGISCNLLKDSDVTNNKFRIEFDAASSSTILSLLLINTERVAVQSNQIRCTADYGANVQVRGFCESGTGLNNKFVNNVYSIDTTKATTFQFNLLTTSSVYVDHAASGSPEGSVIASVGSIWRRTDGGAGTTFYVKESGTSNTGWVAK